MNIDIVDVDAAINNAQTLIEQESHLSPALRSAMSVLLLLVTLLLNRTTLNSQNSSKPPRLIGIDPSAREQSRLNCPALKQGMWVRHWKKYPTQTSYK
ncbi:MAG: transposase [Arenicella sp.]